MPELPEVETIKSMLTENLLGLEIQKVDVLRSDLRWPVTPALAIKCMGKKIISVARRSKYLCIHLEGGVLVVHLGMSGQLKWLNADQKMVKHDHIIVSFNNGMQLRFHDPRRFGSVLWFANLLEDKRLKKLGVEPLTDDLNDGYLLAALKKRTITIKQFLMDAKIVVGVGNIYANEALFLSKIKPQKPSNTLTKKEANILVTSIKKVLTKAIAQGGTTIKDFQHIDGKAGYFKQELLVYGRGGEPCLQCGLKLKQIMIANRQTVYCHHCQS